MPTCYKCFRCTVLTGSIFVVLLSVLIALDLPNSEYSRLDTVDSNVTLKDGRTLSFAVYGDKNGFPVLVMGGTPCQRHYHPDLLKTAANTGARLIVPDRPGWGRSHFKPWSLLEYVEDIVELLDILKIDKVHAFGFSGGGPPTYAILFKAPERLSSASIVAGYGPTAAMETVDYGAFDVFVKVAKISPTLSFGMMWLFRQLHVHIDMIKLIEISKPIMEEHQKIILTELEPHFTFLMQEAPEIYRQGTMALQHEVLTYVQDWGFHLSDIDGHVPVRIWHGEKDGNVPVGHSKFACQHLKTVECQFFPVKAHELCYQDWEDHFSWMKTHHQ